MTGSSLATTAAPKAEGCSQPHTRALLPLLRAAGCFGEALGDPLTPSGMKASCELGGEQGAMASALQGCAQRGGLGRKPSFEAL